MGLPLTVVDHIDLERRRQVPQRHVGSSRPGVAQRVRQRLLDYPEGRQVEAVRQRDRVTLYVQTSGQARRVEARQQFVDLPQSGQR